MMYLQKSYQVTSLLACLLRGPVAMLCQEAIEMEGQARNQMPKSSRDITSDPLLVEPLYKFTTRLLHQLADPKENVIFSPLSIHTALNMLSLGVARGSQTEKDMLEVLGYGNRTTSATLAEIHQANARLKSVFDEAKSIRGKSRRNPKLDMLNFAIVSNKSRIKPEYLNQTSQHYGASVKQVQTTSDQERVVGEINNWGKEAGFDGDILAKQELAALDLMLLNGIRVEAHWFDSFHEIIVSTKTRSALYKAVLDGPKVGHKVLTTHHNKANFVEFTKNSKSKHSARNQRARASQPSHYDELAELEFRAISIPLLGDISYTILEPLAANGTSKELAQLVEALLRAPTGATSASPGSSRLSQMMSIVDDIDHVAANIRMPGFKYEQKTDLKLQLSSMGLSRIFHPRTADLDEMGSHKGELFVGSVKHQAMIDVNEKGIKAAAVTKVVLLSAIFYNEVIEVDVENPFLFLLRLNKVPLFVGHLVKA